MTRNQKFLVSLVVGILVVLTVNAKAQSTSRQQVCPAGQIHVCYTVKTDGTLETIAVDNHGRAVDREEDCEDTSVDVLYGCQPLEAVRAEERERCDELGGRFYWSTTRGGRCVERRPRDTPPAPPTPPTPPQTPPGPGVTTPPPPQGGGQTGGTITCSSGVACPACPSVTCPAVEPVPPGPAAQCTDCNQCADVPGLAAELTPLERVPADQWLVRTDTDEVRSRVLYIRERAGACAEDDVFAATERILAAMTPPAPVTLPPDHPQIQYVDEGSGCGTWCVVGIVAGGVAVGAAIFLGVWYGTEFHVRSDP